MGKEKGSDPKAEKGSDPIILALCENNWIRPLFRNIDKASNKKKGGPKAALSF